MVTSCTDAQVNAGTHTRVALRVKPNSIPNCRSHPFTYTEGGVSYPGMKCNLRDTGFGRNSASTCEPWARFGFKRLDTNAVLEVAYVKHWTWRWQDEDTYFAIYEEDAATARSTFANFFDNTGRSSNLDIEVVLLPTASPPSGYNPGVTESAFTYVYGRGEDYNQLPSPNAGDGSVKGTSRRRWGASDRDYTVFTVNWLGQSRLKPGQTYINRSFQFASELGAVEALGEDLRDKVYVDQIEEVDYNARSVDLYKDGDKFEAVAAATVGGSTTSCGSGTAALSCSGSSTPQSGKSPFFYITCGTNTHVGQDPYHFSPSFGGTFPGHAPAGGTVRSYVCDGQSNSVRPTWKLLGFFSPGDCSGIGSATLDDTVCPDVSSVGCYLYSL